MLLKSKIRWTSLGSNLMLFLFFTLPMAVLPFFSLFTRHSKTEFWSILSIAFFTVPIGLMPMHLLLDGFLAVSCSESSIILKKYFGFWKKQYSYEELRAYSRSSYRRSKGSSKRYAVLNVLFSDGKVYRIDEGNIANYQQICKQILVEKELKEDEKLIHDDNGLYIWLFYVLVALIGTGLMLLILKLRTMY